MKFLLSITNITEYLFLQVTSPELKLERDVYLYSAYIAQKKYRIVIDEISDKSPVELRALKLLAEFFAYPNKK